MFRPCLALTIVFFVMLLVGFSWGLVERGTTKVRRGSKIGAEMMAEKMSRNAMRKGKAAVVGGSVFRGKGIGVEREAEYSYAEIRRRFREGGLRPVLPALMGMAGFLGFFFFLGWTLMIGLSHWIYGAAVVAFSVYSAYVLLTGLISSR